MARGRTRPEPEERGALLVPRSAFAAELALQIERGNELLTRSIHDGSVLKATRDDYYKWSDFNDQLLKRRFSTDELAKGYRDFIASGSFDQSFPEQVRELHDDIRRKLRRLESVREQLPLFDEPPSPVSPAVAARPSKSAKEIFVVHGHDDVRKLEVAQFLERVTGIRPLVLHEQPSEGRTIIEKLEHYSERASFAVVLLTADDEGRRRDSEDSLLPRGRQNVVLELGYFIARLSRAKVVLLYESDVELPSDMSGVLYVRLDDAGGWKLALGTELRATGVEVDLNKAT